MRQFDGFHLPSANIKIDWIRCTFGLPNVLVANKEVANCLFLSVEAIRSLANIAEIRDVVVRQ